MLTAWQERIPKDRAGSRDPFFFAAIRTVFPFKGFKQVECFGESSYIADNGNIRPPTRPVHP